MQTALCSTTSSCRGSSYLTLFLIYFVFSLSYSCRLSHISFLLFVGFVGGNLHCVLRLCGRTVLGGGVVVRLVAYQVSRSRDTQSALHDTTDISVYILFLPGCRPEGDLVGFRSNIDNRTANVLGVLIEALADQQEKQFEPVVIEVVSPLITSKGVQPSPSLTVLIILPHGLNALFEDTVIATLWNT